jgi:hypothetical protein
MMYNIPVNFRGIQNLKQQHGGCIKKEIYLKKIRSPNLMRTGSVRYHRPGMFLRDSVDLYYKIQYVDKSWFVQWETKFSELG